MQISESLEENVVSVLIDQDICKFLSEYGEISDEARIFYVYDLL